MIGSDTGLTGEPDPGLGTARTTPRHIALVAHDNMKAELLRWAEYNRGTLSQHVLYATGTTGTMLEYELRRDALHVVCPPPEAKEEKDAGARA